MSKPTARSPAKSSGRQDRLAKALRANLKRRKAQSRAKAEAQTPGEAALSAPEPGPGGSPPRLRPNMAQKDA